MLKTYTGPFEIDLVIMGQSYGILKKGDSVAVPDDVAASVGWSPDMWEDTKSAPPKKEEGK